MKLLTNKYFILGNLALILLAIPVTLWFVKQQQQGASQAAPTSKLYFAPATITTQTSCPSFTLDVMVDPGDNFVSIVNLVIKFDPTKVEITQVTPSEVFKNVPTPLSISNGKASISLDAVGADITKAVVDTAKVATVTFVPKAAGITDIVFDPTTEAFEVPPSPDLPADISIISQTIPAKATINAGACGVTGPNPSGGVIPTPTPGLGGPPLVSPPPGIPTPTTIASGSATPIPTAVPTAIPTLAPTATPIPTAVPTAAPTIAPTGSIAQSVGIMAAVVLAIIAGFALLAL